VKLSFALDQDILKDLQYFLKFISWHSKASKASRHFKFRSAYNVPVRGHCREYWVYAIKSVKYMLRKKKKEKTLKQRRQGEMMELAELYKMQ